MLQMTYGSPVSSTDITDHRFLMLFESLIMYSYKVAKT